MSQIDRRALLTYLRTRGETSPLLVHAVYAGLAARIQRGDFDVPETPENGGGITRVAVNYLPQKAAPASAPTLEPRGLTPDKEGLIT